MGFLRLKIRCVIVGALLIYWTSKEGTWEQLHSH